MSVPISEYEVGKHPDLPPPPGTVGVWVWLKNNLFSSATNSIQTVFALWMLYGIISSVVDWFVISAVWSGVDADACKTTDGGWINGQCWPFVSAWFEGMMLGRYPDGELWRLVATGIFIAFGFGWSLIRSAPWKIPVAVSMVVLTPFVAKALIFGGLGLSMISTTELGGFTLNLFYLMIGALWALPVGILLALGRQSRMPLIRILCFAVIEFFHGMPFIILLFTSSVVYPLFVPEGTEFDKIVRVQFGVTLYFSTYVAELIRRGMQAVPTKEIEAARASGIAPWRMTTNVILLEALRVAIPGLTNITVSLVKATTLIGMVGQLDFLGVINVAGTSTDWLGFIPSGYAFAFVVFACVCFSISGFGRYLESRFPPSEACKRNFAANPSAADATHAGHSLA